MTLPSSIGSARRARRAFRPRRLLWSGVWPTLTGASPAPATPVGAPVTPLARNRRLGEVAAGGPETFDDIQEDCGA